MSACRSPIDGGPGGEPNAWAMQRGRILQHEMLGTLRKLRKRLHVGSLERGDSTSAAERPAENLDGMTAAHSGREIDTGGEGGGIPPSYVKSYDEGRPRH
jgi:hypothetical protein